MTATHIVARYDATQLTALVGLIDAGVVTVDIAGRYPLEALADVHRKSEAGEIRGKVTVLPGLDV